MSEVPVRVLVVEDEPLYAEQLEAALQDLGHEPIGPAPDARIALALHRTEHLDVALLDVQLRGPVDGIALAAQLLAHRPLPLLFLTSCADEETFAQARQVGPAAYLIKPVEPAALQRAILLAISNFQAAPPLAPVPPLALPAADTLFVKENGLLEKIRLSEVQCVEADNKVCRLVLATRAVVVRMPLRELMQHLPPSHFVQIQRSYFVNLDYVVRLDPVRSLVQVGENLLPVGRTYQAELLRRLPTLG
ncbi:MAG TPA: response regulator transcription factor [Hymenobacter sp.]|uniref:LytR/AlgR family response regulator transcription factor n=1 Tax=Hymenobacter sp. TaxID=1898978 RepID=UPI002D7F054A|nr:response regulator transcription factor [Hymenobacter sp.]HET9504037.1 response regulator transcription factor [Hymenobacter sp.]